MTTMADSLVNSAMRPLKLRCRPDLVAKKHKYHGRVYWVLKEPVGLNYFRFHEEEYAILQMLDGKTSLQAIKEEFQRQFAPQRITLQDLQQFVGMLHRSGLVISDASGQGRQLRRRGDQKKKRELIGKLSNVFALRFRGIDPERMLNFLIPFTWWLFTPLCVLCVALFGLSALMLVGLEYQEFRAKLPTFEQFFAADKWIYLGATMAAVKILHEFGHGLSCKKFGGECHEMGLMFLVFTPCLYCNVSDSWMLPNKWHRVFIGAAGMYVELILASIATWIWWFSTDGMINFLCLSVMFICSVSTVMFNGNPLLRFDGYYILMDILEIPNLRQKSTEILKRWFQQYCLGLELQDNPFLPHRNQFWFALYTIAAVVYRWIVVFSIIIFLNNVLEPYGLKALGRLIAISGLAGMIVQPIWQTIKFFRTPGRASKMKRKRVIGTVIGGAALVGLICFLPLPFHVDCALEIQPRNPAQVFAMVPGHLVSWHKRPGDFVSRGETIAKLESPELRLQQVKTEGDLLQAEARLEALQLSQSYDPQALALLQVNHEVVASRRQLAEKANERAKMLVVQSPADGVVIQPPSKPDQKGAGGEEQLPGWSGNPFAPVNEEAVFAPSDLLCLVGRPDHMEAVLVVDQADIDLVKVGHKVDMKVESARLHTLPGEIGLISRMDMKSAPENLATQSGGGVDTEMDPSGRLRPMSTSYQARVPLDDVEVPLRVGYRGYAKVYVGWKSVGWRFYRFLARTFRFEM